ncbi:hypothetical protein [Winogradskyella psychrotolerans]|uniref:hypothetical protein n=1 Tax=Winogradskyella psychrotolerans TaxID=1344585 RepID=UPI00190F7ED7|nr:hypothetical protein [Winogradskyella psychrotolerans]
MVHRFTKRFSKTLSPGEANNYWNQMGNRVQDHFIYDGSFAKLRQITFGYNFPRSLMEKTPFTNVSLSFVGRNLSILWKKCREYRSGVWLFIRKWARP